MRVRDAHISAKNLAPTHRVCSLGRVFVLAWVTSLLGSGCALLPLDPEDSDALDSSQASLWADRLPASDEDDDAKEEAAARYEARIRRVRGAMQTGDIVLGMTMSEVRNVWGYPVDVDVAGRPGEGSERWTYFMGLSVPWALGRARVLFFENGQLVGWETLQRRD